MAYRVHGELFYLSFSYIEDKKAFVIYTYYANLHRTNLNYKVKMYLEEPGTINPHKFVFEGNVLHIEDIRNVLMTDDLPVESYWTIPKYVLAVYQTYKKNDLDGFYTCNIPVYIDSIIKIESGERVLNGDMAMEDRTGQKKQIVSGAEILDQNGGLQGNILLGSDEVD